MLTEAEHLERLAQVYRYRLLRREEADRLGLDTRGQLILEVEPRWKDAHFPTLTRPTPHELWDTLLDESRTTPLLAVSQGLPNPLLHKHSPEAIARWIGVHEDQPWIYVRRDGVKVPATGYVHPHQPGDLALMGRKRAFTAFAGRHPLLAAHLRDSARPEPFTGNPRPRDVLEDAILATRGVFAVQGPPGTGKTHLATQVVRRFLAATPAGRVLICAKEHFALDHILRKLTQALDQDCISYRAFRSVSLARRRRGRAELETPFLGTTLVGQLAERAWAPESSGWTRFQASTFDQHDQRLLSLAEKAANLFFCTTMDAALLDMTGQTSFDLVIVEEAGKCYPSELLHTLCFGRTVLMIGDQRQLPPYQERQTRAAVLAWQATLDQARRRPEFRQALQARFGDTFLELETLAREHGPVSPAETAWLRPFEYLFDRLAKRHRLEEQFRMEAPLSRLVGKVFYGRPFVHRKLASNPLEGVLPQELDVPLLWIDTPHMTLRPEATEDPEKRGARNNLYERDVILRYLRRLYPSRQVDLVILTPYNEQKRLLLDSRELREVCRSLTDSPFEQVVRTTDEYQGREAELTVLSLVRNNSQGARAWGFMTEPERLNVMFSRTRFRQVVVGCSAHINRHVNEAPHLHAVWKAYVEETADARCARIMSPEELDSHG
ncbi:AAA domain-containing protein [Myxococcus xanthus]|nr:AAA domain-containing protein [Myxococcus xanthus]